MEVSAGHEFIYSQISAPFESCPLHGLARFSVDSYTIAMKLADDPEAATWLENLPAEPDDFQWDEGNRTKHRKHGVATRDVEAMFQHPLLFAGRIVDPAHLETRWLALGQDGRGRRLTLIFTRRGDRVRAISCRPMRPSWRLLQENGSSADAVLNEWERAKIWRVGSHEVPSLARDSG